MHLAPAEKLPVIIQLAHPLTFNLNPNRQTPLPIGNPRRDPGRLNGSNRPSNKVRVVPLGRRAKVGNLVLVGAQHAKGAAGGQRGVGVLEPDVGEGGEAGQAAAVVGALDDPVGVDARQRRPARQRDGVGVALAQVREDAARRIGPGLVS